MLPWDATWFIRAPSSGTNELAGRFQPASSELKSLARYACGSSSVNNMLHTTVLHSTCSADPNPVEQSQVAQVQLFGAPGASEAGSALFGQEGHCTLITAQVAANCTIARFASSWLTSLPVQQGRLDLNPPAPFCDGSSRSLQAGSLFPLLFGAYVPEKSLSLIISR